MIANRVHRLLLVALLWPPTASGCQLMRGPSWEVGEQEEPRNRVQGYKDRADRAESWGLANQGNLDRQRAQNEAAFRVSNPGAKPGGSR